MPRVGSPKIVVIDDSNRAAYFAKAYADFKAGFRRSARGNLWREFNGRTVTVFKTKDGFYGWCIATTDQWGETFRKQFSKATYGTEQEALESLGSELIVL